MSLRMFLPLIDLQFVRVFLQRILKTFFLLPIIWLINFTNLLYKWNVMCFVWLIGSRKYWCVLRCSPSINLCEMFQDFSNLTASLLNRSKRTHPYIEVLNMLFVFIIVSPPYSKTGGTIGPGAALSLLFYFDNIHVHNYTHVWKS